MGEVRSGERLLLADGGTFFDNIDPLAPGKRYWIDGTQEKPEAVQAGQWLNVTHSGAVTTFTLDGFAKLAEEMVG